jgi:hypothetical protein
MKDTDRIERLERLVSRLLMNTRTGVNSKMIDIERFPLAVRHALREAYLNHDYQYEMDTLMDMNLPKIAAVQAQWDKEKAAEDERIRQKKLNEAQEAVQTAQEALKTAQEREKAVKETPAEIIEVDKPLKLQDPISNAPRRNSNLAGKYS